MSDKTFRQAVVAVFVNSKGEVLVGKRYGSRDAWQFPQGGIDPGETQQEALKREVREEIGCHGFTILKASEKAIRYEFPEHLDAKLTAKYRGQELYWFLCQFLDGQSADLAQASDREFDALAWVSPQRAFEGIISWKAQAYRTGLRALGFSLEEERRAVARQVTLAALK